MKVVSAEIIKLLLEQTKDEAIHVCRLLELDPGTGIELTRARENVRFIERRIKLISEMEFSTSALYSTIEQEEIA